MKTVYCKVCLHVFNDDAIANKSKVNLVCPVCTTTLKIRRKIGRKNRETNSGQSDCLIVEGFVVAILMGLAPFAAMYFLDPKPWNTSLIEFILLWGIATMGFVPMISMILRGMGVFSEKIASGIMFAFIPLAFTIWIIGFLAVWIIS